MVQRSVDFWFDFASTYSFISAMRIDTEAAIRGVTVRWRPFLLGPIFAKQGWNTSPFNIYPAKGRYMWRDIERRCSSLGLQFNRPDAENLETFPQNSVLAARVALLGDRQAWQCEFSKLVFKAEFQDRGDISDRATIGRLAEMAGAPPDIIAESESPANRPLLRRSVTEAIDIGIFGAPSFVVGDELFWGDDRLEAALDWQSAKQLPDRGS